MFHDADRRGAMEETGHEVSVPLLADDDQVIVAFLSFPDDLGGGVTNPHPGPQIWGPGTHNLAGSGQERVDRDLGLACLTPPHRQDGQRFAAVLRNLSPKPERRLCVRRTIRGCQNRHGWYPLY
jgi:hypothetical protein